MLSVVLMCDLWCLCNCVGHFAFQEMLHRRTLKLVEFDSAVKTLNKANPQKRPVVSTHVMNYIGIIVYSDVAECFLLVHWCGKKKTLTISQWEGEGKEKEGGGGGGRGGGGGGGGVRWEGRRGRRRQKRREEKKEKRRRRRRRKEEERRRQRRRQRRRRSWRRRQRRRRKRRRRKEGEDRRRRSKGRRQKGKEGGEEEERKENGGEVNILIISCKFLFSYNKQAHNLYIMHLLTRIFKKNNFLKKDKLKTCE